MIMFRKHKIYLFFRLLMLAFTTALLPPALAQKPFLKEISLPAEFSDCTINEALQSEEGFLYFATACGLYRFDGIRFEHVTPGMPGGDLRAVFQDRSGEIWTGSVDGAIARFDPRSVKEAEIIRISGKGDISGIAQDTSGRMWFSVYGRGLCYLDNDSIIHLGTEDGLADVFIYDILADRHGNLWAGSDAGIDILRMEEGYISVDHLDVNDGLPDMMILSLAADSAGNIFAGGYNNGICIIDPLSRKIVQITGNWDYGPVAGILDGSSSYWIATENSGIVRLLKETLNTVAYDRLNGISPVRPEGLLRDAEGNIWIYGAHQLLQIPAGNFGFVFNAPNNHLRDVHALMIDRQEHIWYAARDGLFRHSQNFPDHEESEKILLPENISSRDITCIYQDGQDYVWIGTFGLGLYRLDPNLRKGRLYTEYDGLINNNVLSISSAGGDLWFATLGGASKYVDGRFENFDEKRGLGNNFIYSVLADERGRVWLATDGTGVTRLENGTFTNFGPDNGLKSEKVYDMALDKQGRLWCATHDNGIFYFQNDHFHEIPVLMETNSTISALETDRYNNLLIVHENGLDIYRIDLGTYHSYGHENGIYPIDPEFNSTAQSANGDIWIGTEKGLIRYRPTNEQYRKYPEVVITSVSVFLEGVDMSSPPVFNHQQNHFSFSYAGLWYQEPAGVNYRIMLEGNDLEWNNTGDRHISYSNLAPGQYTFRVQAALTPEFLSYSTASYSFRIKTPFWVRWWFFVIVGSMVSLATWTFIRIRVNRMERIQALEREKIMFQYETLKSQVNPHFLFNSFSTLMNVIEEDRNIALEYVEHLSVFFRNILEYRDKDLVKLEEELEVVENYIYLQKRRYGDNLSVEFNISGSDKATLMPPLTLQLLIENAIKHNIISSAKPLKIAITSSGNNITVKNNLQPKSFTGDSTGFGLKTIEHRYRLFGTHGVDVVETNNEFIVSLPLILHNP